MKSSVTFRIYPECSSTLYFLVHVFPTKRAMMKATGSDRETAAFTSSYRIIRFPPRKSRRRSRTLPIVGELSFYRSCIGTQILSHECAHAAIAYASRRKMKCDFFTLSGQIDNHPERMFKKKYLCSEEEERFCHVFSTLMRGLVDKLYQHKLLK